jgi:type I restriction-modification system DNA methylase subunit
MDISTINNRELTEIEMSQILASTTITNKDALKDKIHEIHNYLRNHGCGYGMNALKTFNFIYALKKLTENELNEIVGLTHDSCNFLKLANLAKENKGNELVKNILNDCIPHINKSKVKELLSYRIPKNITGNTLIYLVKEVDKITDIEKACNVLLSGKIYEYFIGRDESSISELGAYFTDRHIVDFIMKKLNPQLEDDGSVPVMVDPFGGSGGFTTGYINYLNETNSTINEDGKKIVNIDWENGINNIYHFDINDDILASAALEFLCLTKCIPDMKANILRKNAFTDEFKGAANTNKKYKYILTNPPYGGDKVVKSGTQIKREKKRAECKRIILPLYIRNAKLKLALIEKDIMVGNLTTTTKNALNVRLATFEKDIKKKESGLSAADKKIFNGYISELKKKINNGVAYNLSVVNTDDCTISAEIIQEEIDSNFIRIGKIESQLGRMDSEEKQEKIDNENLKVNIHSCSNRIKQFAYNRQNYKWKKEYIKEAAKKKKPIDVYLNESRKTLQLDGTDKEACSLMLMMELLEDGGTAIGVLKEGVVFNQTYGDLRRCLIMNYKLREVISVPQDQFENTSTKTTILIFDAPKAIVSDSNEEEESSSSRGGGQSLCNELYDVIFSELKINRYEEDKFEEINGDIELVESKDDIINVYDETINIVSSRDILKNDICSLNGKDYEKKEIVCSEAYQLVKLGDICKWTHKGKRLATFGQKDGEFNFYTCSDKIFKCHVADIINKLHLIIGHSGNGCLFLDHTFSSLLTNHLLTCDNEILLTYIYFMIKSMWKIFYTRLYSGSTVKNTSDKNIENFKIPIPRDDAKTAEWVAKISAPYDEVRVKTQRVKDLEEEIQQRIKDMGDLAMSIPYEEVELGSICKIYGSPGGEKLGKFKRYDINSDNDLIDNYGFIRGCEVSKNEKLKYYIRKNDYNLHYKGGNNIVKTNDILISACSQHINYLKIPIIWDQFPYHGCIRITNININLHYLIYYMSSDIFIDNILKLQTGSVVKYSNASHYQKIKIKLPLDRQLIDNLNPLFEEIETLQNEITIADILYKQYIKELSDEAIIGYEIVEGENDAAMNNAVIVDDVTAIEATNNAAIVEAPIIGETYTISNTLAELRERCKQLGLKGYSKKNKADLLEMLNK